jgi:hypothetical protein
MMETARLSYVIRASNFLEQSQKIVAPNQAPDERLLTTSMIARMKTKAEFLKIVDDLRQVAKANHLELPDFSVF